MVPQSMSNSVWRIICNIGSINRSVAGNGHCQSVEFINHDGVWVIGKPFGKSIEIDYHWWYGTGRDCINKVCEWWSWASCPISICRYSFPYPSEYPVNEIPGYVIVDGTSKCFPCEDDEIR